MNFSLCSQPSETPSLHISLSSLFFSISEEEDEGTIEDKLFGMERKRETMESFDLLLVKYWRGRNGPTSHDDSEDEGPFFDLEFAVPTPHEVEDGIEAVSVDDLENDRFEEEEDDMEGGGFQPDPMILSKAVVVVATSRTESDPEPPIKPSRRFRVHMFKNRKLKFTSPESVPAASAAHGAPAKRSKATSKFLIKFKIDEVPIMSFFIRNSSARSHASGESATGAAAASMTSPEEKKAPDYSKDVVHKYLRKIKPLYVRATKRLSDQLVADGSLPAKTAEQSKREEKGERTEHSAAAMAEKRGEKSQKPAISAIPSIPARMRVVYERLGKSKSALSPRSAALESPPPQRRDDSILLQQDGIQSAIAHCKRSFAAASKGSESALTRSISDPGEKASVSFPSLS